MKLTHLFPCALGALPLLCGGVDAQQQVPMLVHVQAGHGPEGTGRHLMALPDHRQYELLNSGVAFCFSNGTVGECPCGDSTTGDWGLGGCPPFEGRNPRLEVHGETRFGEVGGPHFARFLADFVGDGPAILLQSNTASLEARTFGNGLVCLGQSPRRVATTTAIGGAAMVPPGPGFDLSARFGVARRGWRYYQMAFRMPEGHCHPGAVGFTNAVAVLWD